MCARCGWGINDASLLVSKEEKEWQTQLYFALNMRKSNSLHSPQAVLKLEDFEDDGVFE